MTPGRLSRRSEFTPVPSHSSTFVYMIPPQNVMPVSQRFGHPPVLGIPIPISLAFWVSPVGDAQNADHFDFA